MSFVDKDRKSDPLIQAKFDVAKAIIDVRLAERDAAETARTLSAREQKLLSALADREEDAIRNKPVAEIESELEEIRKAKRQTVGAAA